MPGIFNEILLPPRSYSLPTLVLGPEVCRGPDCGGGHHWTRSEGSPLWSLILDHNVKLLNPSV